MLTPYEAFSQLADLPPLVRKQRRLAKQLAPLGPLAKDEKAVRQAIDSLLIAAKIKTGDGVTCLGYDVVHCTRKGVSSYNDQVLIAELVAAGLTPEVVAKILIDATETSDSPLWAEVHPSKGAQVRR